jgi:hypothetical protein
MAGTVKYYDAGVVVVWRDVGEYQVDLGKKREDGIYVQWDVLDKIRLIQNSF